METGLKFYTKIPNESSKKRVQANYQKKNQGSALESKEISISCLQRVFSPISVLIVLV